MAAGEPPAFTLSCFCPAGRGSGSFSASLLGSKVDLNGVFILTTPGDFLLAAHISTVAPAASQRAASCLVGLQLGTKRDSDLRESVCGLLLFKAWLDKKHPHGQERPGDSASITACVITLTLCRFLNVCRIDVACDRGALHTDSDLSK